MAKDDENGHTNGVDARIAKVVAQRDEARAELAAARTDLAAAQAQLETVGTLQARVTELEGAQTVWAEERALMGAGLTDPEGVQLARLAWSHLAAADRPKGGIADWVASDRAPRGVRAYMDPGATAAPAAPAAAPAADAAVPPAAGVVEAVGPAAADVTAPPRPPAHRDTTIQTGTAQGAPPALDPRGKDMDWYRAHREQVLKQAGFAAPVIPGVAVGGKE